MGNSPTSTKNPSSSQTAAFTMGKGKTKYTLLRKPSQDGELIELESNMSSQDEPVSKLTKPIKIGMWLLQIAILAVSFTLFIVSRSTVHNKTGTLEKLLEIATFSPALEKVGKISETITFNGTFDFPSVYRGYPNVDVDAAWKRITKVGPFSVTAEDIVKMGKSAEECSKLPEELGGGYMGTIEVFHQLHCLDMIRKYTYLDYYLPKNRDYWGDPLMRVHIDHCIEMLRQVLMCNSDLGIITYNFVEIRPEAWPDFNTVHRCRNFEDVLDWYHERELHTTGSKSGTQITKTAGAFVVATPP